MLVRRGLGAAASLAVVRALAARQATEPSRGTAIVAAAAPLIGTAATVTGLALAADRRSRVAGLATAAFGAAALSPHLASFGGTEPGRATTATLRVTSANVLFGRADAASLVGWAAAHTDVLVVQELTADCAARFSAAGLDEAFPHRFLETRPRAAGIGVWSKHPITETRHLPGPLMPCLAVRLQVPGCPTDPTVVAVHLESPVDIVGWRADLAALPSTLREADAWADGGAVIVAGDFNSTLDMRPFRDGLAGYADAVRQAGAGYPATFPNHRRWTPPLFVIDHVLTLRCTATRARTAGIAGSDHRALLTEIQLG
ncbi:hypothetical protein MMAD_02810 [Mycolicibacterium madagascariense]|uniref:Endonuclease/exonuclease/phosphatase domain-containing protein n=1 Tax=Mycolicibacterium madagascariense TaxID=212765 RepID=A0A7I7X8G9_9MYCO|nr:hypothetical protein MMAD_02810 [Mycolicibacterium madagascariense]